MALTLQELERRLLALEAEVARLRAEQAQASRPNQGKTPEQVWREKGHTGSPPTMDELRTMAEGERRRAGRKKARATNGRTRSIKDH
jgi:hypothetical protein